jgi:hypothetical protein
LVTRSSWTIEEKTILDLPDEILLEVIGYLPYGTRRNVLPLVCQMFSDVVCDLDHTVRVFIHNGAGSGGLTTPDHLRTFSGHRRTTVRSISLRAEDLQFKSRAWGFFNVPGVIM